MAGTVSSLNVSVAAGYACLKRCVSAAEGRYAPVGPAAYPDRSG